MSTIQEAIQRVQTAAAADTTNDPAAQAKLLKEISLLRDAAETPEDRLMRLRFHYLENLCNRIALELGVLQAIAARKDASISAADLAKTTGADEVFIVRIMRLVTYARVVDEVGPGTYKGNATTKLITSPGGRGGELHHTDLGMAVGSKLIEMIRKGKLVQFPEREGEVSPFEYTFGHPIFEFFQHDREQKEAFDDYMAVRRSVTGPQWFETYPAREELGKSELKTGEDAALVVDVGGGIGHEVAKFRESHMDLPGRLVLEDLPQTFEKAAAPEGIEVIHHDFFKEQPVKGARIYYLRQVMHDWSDKKCQQILSQIVKAMDPTYSRVLIDDYILPDTGADRRAAALDFLMFMFASGMERSTQQWHALLSSVGLEIVKIWPAKAGLEGVIEARVKSG
ncbi:hypothetical protein PRZ48_013676 [Zasmidium cellare]|uniref:O-methyltransferase C-terminal domain-containing protein n=1 Tax=Zasmidium cellare TaxID=395010 RepID=A0ABR0E1R6_ZASCE|nr:hypothetical protein PRZ48_013676 [Zasmidium cellare]